MEPHQRIRPLGLRAKVLGIIAISVVIPLLAGTAITRFIGYRAFRNEKGMLFQTLAVHYAKTINQLLNTQSRSLREWAALSDLPAALDDAADDLARQPTVAEDIAFWEDRWPGPGEDEEPIQRFLTNAVARLAHSFQAVNPHFVEVLITDGKGRLAGATNRTEDYWQADEEWWIKAVALKGRQPWMEGIHYDKSAGVYSVDVALACFDPDDPKTLRGVVKGVLEVTPVLRSLDPLLGQEQPITQMVLADGRVLGQLFGHGSTRPFRNKISPAVVAHLQEHSVGWDVLSMIGASADLVGFAGLQETRSFVHRIQPTGLVPMYVTVHEDLATVLHPVYRQLRILTATGGLLVLFFGLLGIVMATRRIISPLRALSAAANTISATARLGDDAGEAEREDVPSDAEVRERIEQVVRIDTGDEIEDLAVDFGRMADRVLNYHDQLQKELTQKTEEVQRDLIIAREFQEALLPKTYPEVPAPGVATPLRLTFAHRYRPALSVGGDFFYVTRITDHRAAVFITDVMGHGTRSALVTAILRTLLHHLDPGLDDAASIMSYINRQFCESVPHGKEFIFATAFCLVIDTSTQDVTCASAGHPPALQVGPEIDGAVPVMETTDVGPALGLAEEARYRNIRKKVHPGDLFLLYTDGLAEAPNTRNENFGEQRLRNVAAGQRHADADGMCESIITSVMRHMDTVVSPDDLCLAAVQVLKWSMAK